MDTATIIRLLQNSGIHVLGANPTSVIIEDPSCIMRGFETFLNYAWTIIVFITGVLLFGWAVSLIRGAKNDIATNLRNLFLIFAGLAMAGPILNTVFNGDLFGVGCKQIEVSIAELNNLMDARNRRLGNRSTAPYEDFQIQDSGAITPGINYYDDDPGFVEPILNNYDEDDGKPEPIFYRPGN
jgi:hypothetical protein